MSFMKKSVLKFLFVAAFTITTGYSVYSSQQSADMSDLVKANVEALARREGSGIPFKGAYSNWDKGGCCELGNWNDECRGSYFCK